MKSGVELLECHTAESNDDAFAEIVKRYVNLVHSVAHRRLSNSALAEEATQLVFIKLAKSRPRFPAEAAFIAWLHRTATNVATDLLRSELRRRKREQEALQMQNSPDNLDEIAHTLDHEIDHLSKTEREIILLRFFGKLRMAEVGATLGISEDAAKMRVNRAVETLRQRLTRAGLACGAAAFLAFLTSQAVTTAPLGLAGKILSSTAKIATTPILSLAKLGFAFATLLILLTAVTVKSLVSRSNISLPATQQETRTTITPTADKAATIPTVTEQIPKLTIQMVNAETGAPVPDALIIQRFYDPKRLPEEHRLSSDTNGQAELSVASLANFQSHSLLIIADGFVPTSVSWNKQAQPGLILNGRLWPPAETETPHSQTFRLDPARTFSGRILDEDGSLVPGVKIRVVAPPSSEARFDQPLEVLISDAGGNWRIPFIPKWWSDADLLLEKEGFARTQVNIPTRDNDPDTVDIVIKRGVSVTGRITNSGGAPMPNVTIREVISSAGAQMNYLRSYDLEERTRRTAVDGEFQFDQTVPYGRLKIANFELSSDGYVTQIVAVPLKAQTNVLNLTMDIGRPLRGKIVDQNGHALERADIVSSASKYRLHAIADAAGKFEFPSAPPQASYNISYFEPATGLYANESVDLNSDDSDHEIRLNIRPLNSRR